MSRRSLLAVGVVALCARVGYVVVFMRGYRPNRDADTYFAIGRAVAEGHGYAFTLPFEYVHATANRPPLYPTVIAGTFHVFGTHVGVAQGVNVVAGCIAAVLGALIGHRISGPRAGLCCGLVVSLYPPLIANDVTVLGETFAIVLLFASVLLLCDGRTAWAGVVLGLLMLDRASAQWFVLAVAGWVLWQLGWQHAVRIVVVAVLVTSPWIVRNAVQVGGPVLVTTNGFNLSATYSDEARASGFVDANFDPRFSAMRVRAVDEVDFDNKLRSKGLHDLRLHPGRVIPVVRTNIAKWLELRPHGNYDPERLDGRNLSVRNWTLPAFYLVTAGGIFALVRARRCAAAQLLALAVAYFSLVSIVSVAVPRLRSLFDASMAVGAGVALAWLLERRATCIVRPPPRRPLRAVATTIILSVLAVAVLGVGFAWQADTHQRARRAIQTAVATDASAIDDIAQIYRASRSADEPPRLAKDDLDRARHLMTVLGARAPQVAAGERQSVAEALRAIRVMSHEADVIGLLSAGEYLDAGAEHRAPSLAAVVTRYEQEIRPGDPSLEPWNAATSATTFARVRRSLEALSATNSA